VKHEACMGQKVDVGFFWEIPIEKRRWKDLDFDGMIIWKRIKSFICPTSAHKNYSKIVDLLKLLKLKYLLQHVSVYINHHQGAHSLCFARVTLTKHRLWIPWWWFM